MTTVRDEVHELFVKHANQYVGCRSDAQEKASADQATSAITNLVLGVKELEWEPLQGAREPIWQARAFMRQCYTIVYEEEYEANEAAYYIEALDDAFPTLEAAKAACQADYEECAQSALTAKPSPVVSDEALELATIAIIENDGELLSGLGFEVDDVRSWARAALTAALSTSPTEADLRAMCDQWVVVTPESNPGHLQSAKLFQTESEARAFASAPERLHHRVISAIDMKALSALVARAKAPQGEGK